MVYIALNTLIKIGETNLVSNGNLNNQVSLLKDDLIVIVNMYLAHAGHINRVT